MKKNSVIGGVIAAAMLVSSAFAAAPASGPLPAGKPAGTKDASFLGPSAPLILAGFVGVFVIVAATGGFDSGSSATGTGP